MKICIDDYGNVESHTTNLTRDQGIEAKLIFDVFYIDGSIHLENVKFRGGKLIKPIIIPIVDFLKDH